MDMFAERLSEVDRVFVGELLVSDVALTLHEKLAIEKMIRLDMIL